MLALVWTTLPLHGCYLLASQQRAAAHLSHCVQVAAQFGIELPAELATYAQDQLDDDSSGSGTGGDPRAVMPCEDLGSGAPESRPISLDGSPVAAWFVPLSRESFVLADYARAPALAADDRIRSPASAGRALLRSKSVLLI